MPRLRLALDAIRLLRLSPGWDTYGAPRIGTRAVLRAAWLALTMRPAPGWAVPTSAGGVQLEWYALDVDRELEIGPNGRVIGDIP